MKLNVPRHVAAGLADTVRLGWSEVDFGVRIFCHGFPLASCKANAIGVEGVSVAHVLSALPVRAYLELEFDQAEINPPASGRIPVFVDKIGELGTNLLFTYPDEQLHWLPDLLHARG